MKIKMIFISLLCYQLCYSQVNYWEIKGRVVENGQKPIEYANIYINNTTIGTIANSNGEFELKISNYFPKIEIVITCVGYQSLKKTISFNNSETFIFQLFPAINVLKEVTVSAKDFQKKWAIFENGLLGKSEFSTDCKILNPEAVYLEYDENKSVIASADNPIYILNRDLGYKIRLQIIKFTSDGTTTYTYVDKYFEKLIPPNHKQELIWNKNRKNAYKNSFRNFLVSLIHDKLKDDFEVFKMASFKKDYYNQTTVAKELANNSLNLCTPTPSIFFFYDENTKEYVLYSEKPLLIFLKNRFDNKSIFTDYPFKYSEVILPKGYMTFSKSGWLIKPNDVILRDNWGNEGISTSLPDDFEIF